MGKRICRTVTITISETWTVVHSLFVNRLLENATLAAALTELPGASDKNSILIGAGFMPPGFSYNAILDLAPDNYYLTNVVADTLVGYEFVVTALPHPGSLDHAARRDGFSQRHGAGVYGEINRQAGNAGIAISTSPVKLTQ